MSRLQKTAVRFDQTPCNDAYTGSFSFNGQFRDWPQTVRDSEVAARRVLSCAPDIVVPVRRVIESAGEVYILGRGNVDTWKGQPIRQGYPASRADGLATINGLDRLCLGQSGIQAYAGTAWIKNDAFTEQDSNLNPKHQIFFSTTTPILYNDTVALNGKLYLVRAVYETPAGFLVADADEMLVPNLEVCSLELKTFNPVTNTSSSSTVSLTAVRLRWQSMFKYMDASAPTFNAGDQQIVVARSVATPKPGHVFVMSDGRWKVDYVYAPTTSATWVCKVCRAG